MDAGSLEMRVPETDDERIAVIADVKGLQQVDKSVIIFVIEAEISPIEPDAWISTEVPLHGYGVERSPVVVQPDPVIV